MESVFQYEIPVLHPLAAHFPLALTWAALLTVLIWAVRGFPFWRRSTLLLLALGLAGALFAYFTGDAMYDQSEGVPIVEELVELHQQMGRYTLWATGVALAATAGTSWWLERVWPGRQRKPEPLAARLLLSLAVLAAAVLVAWTSHIGGTMVWGVAA